jgi:hypothetical protein
VAQASSSSKANSSLTSSSGSEHTAPETESKDKSATKSSRVFKCKKFQLNPTLSFLGESTPSVEKVFRWLGIKDIDHTVPKATHEGVTESMEEILRTLWQLWFWMEKLDKTTH